MDGSSFCDKSCASNSFDPFSYRRKHGNEAAARFSNAVPRSRDLRSLPRIIQKDRGEEPPLAAQLIIFWQHLTWRLPRAQALVVFVFLRNVPALIELAAFLAADDHCDRSFADSDFGVNLVRFHKIDFSGADEHIAALTNFGISGLRAVIEPIVAHDPLTPVEHAIKRIDMRVIVDACALTLARISFG